MEDIVSSLRACLLEVFDLVLLWMSFSTMVQSYPHKSEIRSLRMRISVPGHM